MIEGLQIRATIEKFRGGKVNLFGIDVNSKSHSMGVVEYLSLTEHGAFTETPSMCSISTDAAQQLMDDLWQCGLRPSEGTGSAGAMAAVEKHLADMRTIAFNRLKIGDKE